MPKKKIFDKDKEAALLVLDQGDPNKEKKALVCAFISNGRTLKGAAAESGVGRATVYRWQEEDETFKTQIEASEQIYQGKLVECANRGSIRNPDIALRMLAIKNRDEWSETKKVKHEGSINVTTTKVIAENLQKILEEDKYATTENDQSNPIPSP